MFARILVDIIKEMIHMPKMEECSVSNGIVHLHVCAVLLLATAGCVFAQTEAESLPEVRFAMEPNDVCLHLYLSNVGLPVFYCNIDGLTDQMKVLWLMNETVIPQEEYTSGNYTLLGNHTNGAYNLKILRGMMRTDDHSRYTCAVYLLLNASQTSPQTLLTQSRAAKLKVNFYMPGKQYPRCSISVPSLSSPSPLQTAVGYEEGTGFTISCCSETVNPEMELLWIRENHLGRHLLAGLNASRKSEKNQDACLTYDVVNHMVGDTYTCELTIPQVPKRTGCRKHFKYGKTENRTTWLNEQKRKCTFHDRGIQLLKQDESDATFTCLSKGAIEYLWEFTPPLDKDNNQYHMSRDSVLLNLDSLSDRQYNITCTALGKESIGSRSLIIQFETSSQTQNAIKTVAISLGASVFLVLILLILYIVKTRLLYLCKDNHTRVMTSQEMRARLQIRRNMSGNASGLYAFPSSRMASSSITPLMEGPEDVVSTTERERPPSPRPPRPGLVRTACHVPLAPVQGAVGGIILEEEEMVECQYQDDDLEFDPKNMNVEGLQYADLEFSEDEDDRKDQDSDEDSQSGDEVGDTKEKGATAGRPRIDYADIVHFDPRRNSDPRRSSEARRNSEMRRNNADPWRKM